MTTVTESFRSGMCVWTSRAIDGLKGGMPGDRIDREQMASIVGRNVEAGMPGYGNVCSAIRYCMRVHRVLWAWDRSGKAWVCLDTEKKVVAARDNNRSVSRKASKTLNIAACVDVTQLNTDQKRDFDLAVVQAAMAKSAVSSAMSKRLETNYKPGIEPPKLDDIAGLFAKK